MDDITRQFEILIRRLRSELHDNLSNLSNDLHRVKDSIDKHWKSYENTHQANLSVSITNFRTDVAIPVENKTKKTKKEWVLAIVKGAFELAGISAAVWYAFTAYGQLQEQIDATNMAGRQTEYSRKALNVTIKQFQIDQRPFIIVLCCTFGSPLAKGAPIQINVNAKNIGKGPALNIQHPSASCLRD